MLDFKNNDNEIITKNINRSFRDKIKNSIKKEITAKNARTASFISLASVLSACNFGGSSDSIAPVSISAIKGPLSDALAFIDRDNDGVFDDGEEFGVTGSTGSASISPNSAIGSDIKFVITSIEAGQTIGGVTYTTGTVDTNTGGAVADLVLKAPSTAKVVTPVTTIMAETTLTEAEVKSVLGLPAEMDVLNFNPFAENLSAADQAIALEAEKVALKVYTTVSTIQASAKSAGLDLAKSFETAIEAVAEVVQTKSAAGATADLADSSIIAEVVTATSTKLETKLTEAGFDAATVTAKVNANTAVLETAKAQIQTINEAAEAITSFDAAELGAIAKLAVKSGEEAAAAVTAEIATPGAGAASFTMQTASAVAEAKATAKAEVEAAQAEAAGEEDTTTTTTTAVSKPFVLASNPTDGVDWAVVVDASAGGDSQSIDSNTSSNASYTVSGSTMTINLGQSFSKLMVEDMLTSEADLTISLALASLPTVDDTSANTTTVTITEIGSDTVNTGGNSTMDSGEGKIVASSKSTYKATSTTTTEFTFVEGEPLSMTYTPRSGNSDVSVNIANPGANTFLVGNDGTIGNTYQSILEIEATKFFDKIDDYSGNFTKANLMSNFLTDSSKGVHISMSVGDLGIYSGSTKIQTIETTLNIGNNPTVGGAVTGTPRTGATLTAAAISDLDGIDGQVTWQWQSNDDASDAATNASSDTTWSAVGSAVQNTGESITLTLPDQGATGDLTGSNVRVKATYTDKQGNSETFYSNYTEDVKANNPATFASGDADDMITGSVTTGSTLTVTGAQIRDADGFANAAPTSFTYQWQESDDNGASDAWADISGATSTTYSIDAAYSGKYIRAQVKYTDVPADGSTGTDEVVSATGVGPIVADPIYFEKESSSADGMVIGVYLDVDTLSAMTNAQSTTNHVTKLQSYSIKFDVKGTDTFATHFESGGYGGSGYVKMVSIPSDGATSDGDAILNTTGSTEKFAATVSDDGNQVNIAMSLADGSYDYSAGNATNNVVTDTTKYLIGKLRMDPKADSIGQTVTFTFDPTNAAEIGYDSGDAKNPGALALGTYDFSIVL